MIANAFFQSFLPGDDDSAESKLFRIEFPRMCSQLKRYGIPIRRETVEPMLNQRYGKPETVKVERKPWVSKLPDDFFKNFNYRF